MALALGTNCGFVSAAPSSDPSGSAMQIDDETRSIQDTSPSTATKITEIGWYCDNATEESNFEVGIYSDTGADAPDVLVSVARTNAKGTGAGWKVVSGLNISISSSTKYWLALQCDDTATTTNSNWAFSSGKKAWSETRTTTLTSPWTTGSASANVLYAIYAVWEAAATTQTSVNIGDTWKQINWPSSAINIGDTWKAITGISMNVGDTWKKVWP